MWWFCDTSNGNYLLSLYRADIWRNESSKEMRQEESRWYWTAMLAIVCEVPNGKIKRYTKGSRREARLIDRCKVLLSQ